MKALLILACTAIGILVGYAISDGFGGGPSVATAVNGLFTLILMAAGGGIGLAVGAVIALILWSNEREASARQDSSDPE
ncbi:hypothetical protein CY658_23715 [Variovorax sp. RO1]|uniref:hypothetical protein n=1 Tax=Variovorax sp. RO1 TaxID=2066034 RepID=UPI000CAAA965|nr:hypothetical protein [Variovorax sp. RO1]PLC02916.1 hypothetical protein CY658_23715 [Variovorax sp. RO1]